MKHRSCLLLLIVFCALTACAQRPSFNSNAPRLSILGDSYSTFEGYLTPDTNAVWYWNHEWDCTDVRNVRQTWWHQLLRDTGMRLCVNNSFSGATICHTGYDQADYSDRSFCTRLTNLGSPDIILVFGATNDEWAHAPIGEYKYADWTREDLYKFRPAMAYLLCQLIDHYPNVKLYFILNDILSSDINESVLTVCQHYQVPVIRLENIDKQCGHPNVLGMQQIAQQVEKALGYGEE
ncbi:MAG: hypothetical protein II429_06265 [Prevotella sp.]|jgi:hypothetical protein|nr:hypothetical protein [Prevotella sp.]MBQ2192852.1 hypothetical protein [Prevotella sp.]